MQEQIRRILSQTTEIDIHFYDVDSINIVWHGNYVKYLENGREAFGEKFGIGYMDIYNNGFVTPIVDMHIKYIGTVKFGETLLIETRYVSCPSAKLMFNYTIYRKSDMAIVAEASTIQLFMTKEGEFILSAPDFYRQWKEKWNV